MSLNWNIDDGEEYVDLDNSSDIEYIPLSTTQADVDAAYAQQLQVEEYSKPSQSSLPCHPYLSSKRESNYEKYLTDPDERPMVSDAELAAHMQVEENNRQQKRTVRRQSPSQRPQATRTSPLNQRVTARPGSAAASYVRPTVRTSPSDNGTNYFSTLLHAFATPPQISVNARLPNGRAANNLQNMPDNFGPEHYEQLLQLDESTKTNILTKQQINTLPTEKYRPTSSKQNEDQRKCSICMDQFELQQTLRRLPCFHVFHQDCIDRWLKTSNICPICREEPIKQPVKN